ncbi:MAG: RNA polymerase sigma factor [Oscillospiraceae bacterium]|nr:RNA polymerase sigma factor [Oscillospiraceae bacterium]
MNSFGTTESICRAVEKYSSMLLRLAMTRLASPADAEDTVQEVFLRLMTKAPTFRDDEHEKAWLIRTTLNYAANLRKSAAYQSLPLDETISSLQLEQCDLLSAVQQLPDKYSAVIHLHYYEGYTLKEISKLLGLPVPTVGTRLTRGREKLRNLLKEDYK